MDRKSWEEATGTSSSFIARAILIQNLKFLEFLEIAVLLEVQSWNGSEFLEWAFLTIAILFQILEFLKFLETAVFWEVQSWNASEFLEWATHPPGGLMPRNSWKMGHPPAWWPITRIPTRSKIAPPRTLLFPSIPMIPRFESELRVR